ncbi:MAG TPA: hypothetical protein VHL34_04135 [Rhizomicrobium sp.]|jgi:hypothetical protein|nr:hypothetical protein [Rhizomicrobium sp.]
MQTALLLNQPDLIAPHQARLFRFGDEGRAQVHILNARGRLFEGGGDEPELSLKWIPNGTAHYASDGVQFPLEGDVQLLLNRGQAYRLRMTRASESFVLFFPRALTDRAWRAFSGCDENFPEAPAVAALSQQALHRDLAALRAEAQHAEPDGARLEELSFAVLTGMAERVRSHRRMRDAIPALRGRTRDELLRRAARAASYLIESRTVRRSKARRVPRRCRRSISSACFAPSMARRRWRSRRRDGCILRAMRC